MECIDAILKIPTLKETYGGRRDIYYTPNGYMLG